MSSQHSTMPPGASHSAGISPSLSKTLQEVAILKMEIEKLQELEVQLLAGVGVKSLNPSGMPQGALNTIAMDMNTLTQINDAAKQRIQLYEKLNMAISALNIASAMSAEQAKAHFKTMNEMEGHLSTHRQIASKIAQSQGSTIPGVDDTQMRLVELNTYRGDKYAATVGLMKIIAAILLPLTIVIALMISGPLNNAFGSILILIILVVGGYYGLGSFIDLFWRDNMNFNEFAWDWSKESAESGSVASYDDRQFNNRQALENELGTMAEDSGDCVGQSCCGPGTVYNHQQHKCLDVAAYNS